MSIESQPSLALPDPIFSQRRYWASEQAISFLMQQAVENRDVISLAAGLVDPASLPVEETEQAVDLLLSDRARARDALQYGTTAGAEPLREELVRYLAKLERRTADDPGFDTDQLVLTTGSQQFLSLVGEVLFNPDDICLVAAPTYFAFLGVLNGLGARAVPVPADENGMCCQALEATLARIESAGELDRVKLIYVVSDYENPSGISLSPDRRREVVEIAQRWSKLHRLYVLEDAAYRELHYDGPKLPSVWSFDADKETVILAMTFSKSYAPGLRVGFGVAPHDLVGPICDRKGNEDFGSANFNQHLLATVLAEGLFDSHAELVRDSYRAKRDAMLAAADAYFSDLPGVEWVRPHGGLYVWMSLPERIATGFQSDLFQRATRQERVMYVPGELCYGGPADERATHQMRLSFGVQSADGIDVGMQRLSRAVRAFL